MDSLLKMNNGSRVVCADVYDRLDSVRQDGVVLAEVRGVEWCVWRVWKDENTDGGWEATGGEYFSHNQRLAATVAYESRRDNPAREVPPSDRA